MDALVFVLPFLTVVAVVAYPVPETTDNAGIISMQGSYYLNTTYRRLLAGKKIAKLHRPPEGENQASIEGDLKSLPEELGDEANSVQAISLTRKRRKAVTNAHLLWPKKTVVYEFERDLPTQFRENILAAIESWQKSTCIRFLKYSEQTKNEVGHNNRVRYYKGSECSSEIGYRRGLEVSETSIGNDCNYIGTIAHEIGHSIGFYHEQARNDRDRHVTVFLNNVKKGAITDFNKYSTSKVRTNLPYDIGSVMHYGPTWFSKDGVAHTIEPKHSGMIGVMGQRDGLSFMDIKTANTLYQCSEHCPRGERCLNGGYPGPKCSCTCPSGITGSTCNTVTDTGCGGVLTGTTGTFTTPNHPSLYGNNVKCNWLIVAGPSRRITLTFSDFELENEVSCPYDWLEVHTLGPDLAGPKVCGGGPPAPIVYHGDSLFLQFQSDEEYSFKGFQATYSTA